MSLREKLAEKSGISKEKIPNSYQIIGDIFLIKSQRLLKKEKKALASAVLEVLPHIKTVCELSEIKGVFRMPKINILAGCETETIHKENGILYKIDVSRVMFSKGNLYERQRLIKEISPNVTVVDMFAGIGYFSLGIGKFSKAKIIYAIEKNPYAFKLLQENIKLNKITNIVPILGDCRQVAKQKNFQGIADHVIMGYIKDTDKFLPSAFSFSKNHGIIHYHNIFKKEDLWKRPIETIKYYAEKNGYEVEKILEKRKVKSYAPKVFHIVLDAKIRRRIIIRR
ncbi:MAG: class I SAM-dependent methyltransferase family protein [Candidatus Aenigmatarchaeota archaeon]